MEAKLANDARMHPKITDIENISNYSDTFILTLMYFMISAIEIQPSCTLAI